MTESPRLTLPQAKLVVPVDTSTSTVITPGTEPQMRVGRTELATWTDVVYANPGEALKTDILAPRASGPRPLVVYVTGGGFMAAVKENNLDSRGFLAEAGFVVASIQYRTAATGATYADSVQDVKAAVRFLRANAAEYGIDPGHVGLWGESAGGYLVSMAALTAGDAVQAVVDKFGGSDLAGVLADYDPESTRPFAQLTAVIDRYAPGPDANTVTHVSADAPPFLVFHGDADTLVSPSQTLLLHNALQAAGATSTRYVVADAGHGEVEHALGRPEKALPWTTEQVMGLMVDFYRTHLG
jgi:acetyl esterase/lipase